MGGLTMLGWGYFALTIAVVVGPVFLIGAILRRSGRSRWWVLLWLVLPIALYAYVVISYPR